MDIWAALVLFLIWVITAIPLWLAQKFLGGKGSLFTVLVANILVAIASALIEMTLDSIVASLAVFIIMLFIYKVLFRIGWIRALLVWLLQFLLIAIFVVIASLLGLSLLVF